MSHSIFHQTLLCQTQSVAEYQSKVNSRGIVPGTLFQSQSVEKEKKLLLSTNFRGNRLCVRKRRVAMGKNQSISRAVLTSNAASELSEKFSLDGNIEMQVNLSSSGSGGATQVDVQVSNSRGSMVLHWGIICESKGKWVLPSRRPNGTQVYKNRALRTAFVKSGSGSSVRIEIDDPAAQAIEFLVIDESQNKWYKNHGDNFHIKLPVKDKPVQQVSVPEDLVQIQAYIRWERKGKQSYSPDQEKEEYEAARSELLEEVARGTSVQDIRARLTNKTSDVEVKEPNKPNAAEVKEPSVSKTKTIPDELVQIQAFIRWEKAGKPNYSPEQQLIEFEEARKELLSELQKGASVDEIRRKITKGEIQTKVSKQLKSKQYFQAERIQRKKRDLTQLINSNAAKNADQQLVEVDQQFVDAPKTLSVIERYAKEREEYDTGSVLSKKTYKLADKDLLVLITKDGGKIKVHLATDYKIPVTLHWALSKTTPGEWLVPPESSLPPGSVIMDKAVETPFKAGSSSDPSPEVQSLDIEVNDDTFKGLTFVVLSDGKWFKNSGSDFCIEFGGKKQIQKDFGDGKGTAKFLLDKIAEMESEAQKSFMHRFNIAADLIDQAKNAGQLGLAGILVWMRFMATRQLIWNKNYNVKPREISKAQDRLTELLQNVYASYPQYREVVRMILSTVGRGGEGDVGQRIRDEILVIQRNNDCKGGIMEEWHQKLHNNTSPDDVVICQALIDYINRDFDIGVYWKTLNDNGITKERLLSYDRAIHSEPNFRRDQKEGLLRDLGHYMRTLKAVHSGADLESAISNCLGYKTEGQGFMVGVQINPVPGLPSGFSELVRFVMEHVEERNVEPLLEDLNSGKMIGSAKESGGLYYFDIGFASQLPSKTISSCFESFSVLNNKDDNIMAWHLGLGHPSFRYLKHLFPKLFHNKNFSSFKCEACEFPKHHRSQFSIQPYKPSKPFSIIHSDVWGPNRTSTLSQKKWFITFIDDHTRVCWVYLLKGKSDVCQAVKNFFIMVQNQFQTNIQVFRSDNGKEYFNTILDDFFLKNGIVHQSSCPNTPQQNGVAERKNRHLLEVARALLFSNKVPKYLWGEAVLTAAYLINRMPSKILNFQTPINTFKECFPSTRVLTDLTLRIFGCTAFVHEHKNVGKLEPRAIKCVFVGYSPTQKGYKCFDPKNKKMFVTMDVTFFENKPFFDDTHQGWDIKEDLFQIEDMSFLNNLSLPASQSSVTYTSAPTKIGHDSLTDPTPVKSKELCESKPTFSHEKNNEIPENNNSDDLIEMPQNNESLQENRFELGNGIWKGKVFVKKHHKERDESTSQHCQESEPGNDQPPKNRKGKSISVSESRILYPDIDDPVAIRKPVRSCTKHPMSNFISYSNLSSSLSAFTSKLSSVEIPKNVQIALEIPKWREAVLEEMKALEKNKTWSVTTLPDGKKTVGCKWVFTVKYNSDGSIERYKARLVAKGFTQTYGIDYSETFAPVAKLNTVRILLSLAANLDWPLHQLDVKNAFLNGDLEEEVYMDTPPGFENKYGSNVCKLNKSLYGLKQSPRAWFEKFTQSMKKQGYIQGQADHTLFTKFSQDGKFVVLIVYVDDIVLTGDDTVEMARVKEKLAVDFEIKDLGSMRYFLGMEVARSKNGIVVSQQKYILDLLKETGMSGCRPADTPMDPNAKLWGEGNVPVDTGRYQRLVGKLIYLAHTRPDIAFSVSVVSQFMHSPYEEHLEAVYRILRYLKGNPGKGLHFKKTIQRDVSIFTDADWAGSVTDRRSTSGYCTYVWGNLVTWRSKKQGVVARSSAEAEFRAMSQGICEGLWILRVLEELKMKLELPLKLYSDSKAAISIAHNPVQHDRTKHIEIDRHFIKEKLDAGIICLPFVTSNQQTADILTKSLARPTFEHLIDKLGMIDIYAPI